MKKHLYWALGCALMGGLAAPGADLAARFGGLGARSAAEVAALNAFEVAERRDFEDA